MKLADYIPLARRTMKELPLKQHIEHMSLGIIGEVGEFADGLKKHAIYGKGVDLDGTTPLSAAEGGTLDKVNLMEEGGDAFWYIAGCLPELGVGHDVLQGAFDYGLELGANMAASDGYSSTFVIAQANAQIGTAVYNLLAEEQVEQSQANANVQIIGKNMGMLYGYFGLSFENSLDRNIAKLAKRYGDKFSEDSALNRDLPGERQILERRGQPQPLERRGAPAQGTLDILDAPNPLDQSPGTVPTGVPVAPSTPVPTAVPLKR